MAGQNAVAAFSTVTQVVDACVLSMGLTGIVVLGAGLVVSCVPGLSATGAQITQAGGRILDARRDFARTAADGIERLEATLPLLIVANSASCVEANAAGGVSYAGCALPFPAESRSDFSGLEREVDDERLSEFSGEMGELSDEMEEASRRAEEALERGWRADCGSSPYCLRERAASLASLGGALNPSYPSPAGWTFAAPLLRARNYYAARLLLRAGLRLERGADHRCRLPARLLRVRPRAGPQRLLSGARRRNRVHRPSEPAEKRRTDARDHAVHGCALAVHGGGRRAHPALLDAVPRRHGRRRGDGVCRRGGRRLGRALRGVPHGRRRPGEGCLRLHLHRQRLRAPLAHHRGGIGGLRAGEKRGGGARGAPEGACRGGRGVLLAGARAAERRAALASALRERGDASPWSHEMP